MIDTSDVYGGLSEQIIGRWLAGRPREITDRVVLTTKGRFTTGPDVNDLGLSRRHLRRALYASLGRLGVETVDRYQMHGWDAHTPVEEMLSFSTTPSALERSTTRGCPTSPAGNSS
jgi:aryl-alcohol dehydrogenase (NADP+)